MGRPKKTEPRGVEAEDLGRKRRYELAKVLGYQHKQSTPVWSQLLREVQKLMKDSEDLQTARRILRL